jgi:hypothetical protein
MKRVAGKLSRDVRKFWLKINKIIAYKQKLEADEIRQKVNIAYSAFAMPWYLPVNTVVVITLGHG